MHDEESQPQDGPDNNNQSVEDSVENKPRIEASGRGIYPLEPTIGVKSH